MTHIKSVFLILCIFGSLQLFSMEITLHKKIDAHCWWKGVWFFAKKYDEIPKDIANIILYKSYLLRVNAIYKKFDPFFLFDPKIVKFKEYPDKIKLCRKFDTIEPHDFLFFTHKQDKILSSLVSKPEYFHHDEVNLLHEIEGLIYPVLRNVIFRECKNYSTLPTEFRQKLTKYPMFYSFK